VSTDLPLLTDMKPRLVTTLAGNPGGRVMQSFTRAPWTDEFFVAYVDSVVSGGPSNLRIARCDSSGAMLDYAVLQGGGHGASITSEYESGKVWIWLFWGSDVGYGTGTAVRWAYNGTPNGATVLLADAQTVPDPGAGDPEHVNGYFAIDQAKDRLATKFSSGTTETYTLWKLSDYKAGTGSPLFTAPTTWPTGDLSAFQGFTTSDKSLYITRGGSSVTDQAPTLYELDWATGAITHTLDISQLAATTSAGADGGHNEAEGVCLWRDSGGNPELLFGIDTGPTSNRRGLIFRLAAPVDGTATKTVQIDAENVTGEAATNVVASFRYDRTVRSTTGGFTPTAYEQPVKLSESTTVELKVSDHPDLTDDSFGFVIYGRLDWDDPANPGRRKTATYTAQLSAADPAVVPLSQRLVAAGAVAPGQVIAGAPGRSPLVTMVGDQVAVDGVVQGPHLTGAGTSDATVAPVIASGTQTKAALNAQVDAHLAPNGILRPATVSHADVQAALTTAATSGQQVQAGGTYSTDQTLVIGCDCDLSDLTINYTGSGLAVQFGGSQFGQISRKTVKFPHVICATKQSGQPVWPTGTQGVKVVNAFRCHFYVPHIKEFESGLILFGDSTYGMNGVSYCTFDIVSLENNLVNQLHDHNTTNGVDGWVTQCTFIGGSWSHQDGVYPVIGMRHIKQAGAGSNHTWINPSLEGRPEEQIIEFGGSGAVWLNPRFEWSPNGNPPMQWNTGASVNMIIAGYETNAIVHTLQTGAQSPTVIAANAMEFGLTGSAGVTLSSNGGASNMLTVMPTSWRNAGLSTATNWVHQLTGTGFKYKSSGDANPRYAFDYTTRALTLGSGINTQACTIVWGSGNPNGVQTANVGSLYFDYGQGMRYNKVTGTGNTGWVADAHYRLATKTVSYTIDPNLDGTVVFNGSSLTATLPDPTTVTAGRQIVVKNIAATALTVVSAGTTKTIDGAASASLAQWGKAKYVSDGTQWLTI